MAPPTDPRRVVGARVHARASLVTSLAECSRLFGSNARTKVVAGTVREVLLERPNNRQLTKLGVEWLLPTGSKLKTLPIASCKAGDVQDMEKASLSKVGGEQQSGDVLQTEQDAGDDHVSSAAYSRPVAPAQGTQPPVATVHGVEWFEEDVRIPIGGLVPRIPWCVRCADGSIVSEACDRSDKTPYDYFMMMYPHEHLITVCRLTNKRLVNAGNKRTTVGEILKFYGILVLMTRFEFGKRADLWSGIARSKYVQAPEFGKTGMSRKRFSDIAASIRFSEQPEQQGLQSSVRYRWSLVNDFVDAINRHRKSTVTPSEAICVDESISRWYGLGGHWIDIGLPHYVAIDRKPEDGCEIQNAACGRSGIMLNISLVTTSEDEAVRIMDEKSGDIGHGTAVLARLVSPWAGSWRVVCADSYFSSVEAAKYLLRMGLKFIGVVKTATRMYPMKNLSMRELAERGQRVSLVARDFNGNVQMMAMMWLDRNRQFFIATTSTTLEGRPYSRTRWRQLEKGPARVDLVVPQPEVAEMYYSTCAQIDRHNRCRQDDLMLERKIGTHDWSFRTNCSLLGMIIVDAWLVYSGGRGARAAMEQRSFYEKLADQLIDNQFDYVGLRDRSASSLVDAKQILRSGRDVHLTPTKKRRKTKDGVTLTFAEQGRCTVCKFKKSTYICSSCADSGPEAGSVWLCHSKFGRDCFDKHVKNVHD
jgi:Transposase IS4